MRMEKCGRDLSPAARRHDYGIYEQNDYNVVGARGPDG